MPFGYTSCQRDQHTLDIRALQQGLRGERRAATVVVRLDPNLLQPQSEGEGNSRMAGLMMRKEIELARSSFGHSASPPTGAAATSPEREMVRGGGPPCSESQTRSV